MLAGALALGPGNTPASAASAGDQTRTETPSIFYLDDPQRGRNLILNLEKRSFKSKEGRGAYRQLPRGRDGNDSSGFELKLNGGNQSLKIKGLKPNLHLIQQF
jgi:hypothetical protein